MFARLAWRSIGRNRRRTVITIITIAFAVTLSVSMRGLQLGTYDLNIRNAVELFSGYLQVQHPDFQDKPSLRRSFNLTPDLLSMLGENENVTGLAPRIYAEGLASFRGTSQGAALFGVDPEREREITTLDQKIRSGRFPAASSAREVVLGKNLLENLGAQVGDSIVVLSRAYDGSMGNLFFTIVGTLSTGSPEFDKHSIFMGLEAAQDLLSMGNRVTAVAISLKSLDTVKETQQALESRLKAPGLVCLSWKDLMPELEQSIRLDNVSGILMLAILVVVAAFGVLNTLVMSVTERFKEFGILLAIGMPNRKILTVLFMEFMIILLFGMIGGNLISVGINAYIVRHPIEFTGGLDAVYEEFGFVPRMTSTLSPGVFVRPSIAIFMVSLLAFVYPGLKVFRLEAMKGIRYT